MKTRKKKFITSALPYVNNQPHLGNVVGSVLSGDVYSRYCKKMGYDTVYISGTDEYGTATEMEAMKQNKLPKEIVEENRILHRRVYEWFGIEFNRFGSTATEEHNEMTQKIFMECWNNGYFEEQETEQFFCGRCEQFLADRYVEGICGFCNYQDARGDQCDSCGQCLRSLDLQMPKCVICLGRPEIRKEKHLMLKLDLLKERVETNLASRIAGWSKNAQRIYTSWIEKDLHPRSMTRSLKYRWGVPVPLQDYRDKVFYVWFDAPIGYFTFLKQFLKEKDWQAWACDAELIQFMGKDNVPFHSLIFPSILLATAGPSTEYEINLKYPLVNIISSTEYLMFNGSKFSKSRKVGIFGMDLVDGSLGAPDLWRFYLLSIRPENKDSDFSICNFIEQTSSKLVANWGNLCNRVLMFIKKRLGGVIELNELDDATFTMVEEVNLLYLEYKELMEQIKLREGLEKALEISAYANKYVQDLQGRDKSYREYGFGVAYSLVVLIAHILEPFTPYSSRMVFKMCCVSQIEFPERFTIAKSATILQDISLLFLPFTDEQISRLESYIPVPDQ